LTDGASLAWRLRLDGIDTKPPLWDLLVALPDRPGFTFGNAHHALALAGARDATALRDYSENLDRLASHDHPTAGACAEFARALGDLVLGDNEQAVDRLIVLYPQFRAFGGIRAQPKCSRTP
jgi:hypothetical protein